MTKMGPALDVGACNFLLQLSLIPRIDKNYLYHVEPKRHELESKPWVVAKIGQLEAPLDKIGVES